MWPIQNTVGGKRMRIQSMSNLAQQHTIHGMYATGTRDSSQPCR